MTFLSTALHSRSVALGVNADKLTSCIRHERMKKTQEKKRRIVSHFLWSVARQEVKRSCLRPARENDSRETTAEIRPADMFLFHVFMLLPAAAAVVQREGDMVTLTCGPLLDGQQNCDGTTWNYNDGSITVELVGLGKVRENPNKSDRLSVPADCSLHIKNVTVQDVGQYHCQHFKLDASGKLIRTDVSSVVLSVAAVTKEEVGDEVKLKCFVTSINDKQEVKWKIKDQEVDKDHSEIKTSKDKHSFTLTLKKSHYLYPRLDFLSCEVTDGSTGGKLVLRPRPSGGKEPGRKPGSGTNGTNGTSGTNGTNGTNGASGGSTVRWWWYLVVAVGLILLLIAAVMVVRWSRTKGTQPAVEEYLVDPEDGVSYTTISYSKKTDRKLQVDGGDGGESATYITVRAAASCPPDPDVLYSTVQRQETV